MVINSMTDNVNPLEFPILSIMYSASAPLGAGVLREQLTMYHIVISEAGVGRALRYFRQEGLLERKGFKGHTITDAGVNRLLKLKESKQCGEMLKEILSERQGEHFNLYDILIARRAIEREAAYQAAMLATPEDISELETIVAAQYEKLGGTENNGGKYVEFSAEFHKAVIRISKSHMLAHLYNLIGISVQWQNFFVGTFKMFKQPLNVSHDKILQAIKNRDPHKAAQLMEEHITVVIENAKRLHIQ